MAVNYIITAGIPFELQGAVIDFVLGDVVTNPRTAAFLQANGVTLESVSPTIAAVVGARALNGRVWS